MPKSSINKYLFAFASLLVVLSIHCEKQQEHESHHNNVQHQQSAAAASAGAATSVNSNDDLLAESLINDLLQQEPTLAEYVQHLPKEQRLELFHNVLAAAVADDENNDFDDNDDDELGLVASAPFDDGDSSSPYYLKEKRDNARSKGLLQKKDAQQLRRQAARWDIGFGKRVPHAAPSKSKAFMDALFGKRSVVGRMPLRTSYGRRQQWDLQYGK